MYGCPRVGEGAHALYRHETGVDKVPPLLSPPRQRSVRGRRRAAVASLWFGLVSAACGIVAPDAGPLPVRNQHPAQLLAPHLDPVPAPVLPSGAGWLRFDNAYTSYWLTGGTAGNGFIMDGELWRTAADLRLGLGAGLELELEVPFGLATGGALDSFVIHWHDAFGFAQGGRDLAPRNEFDVSARVGGQDLMDVEAHELQMMDLPIGLRAQVLGDQRGGLALRAMLELPTGDQRAGFGNGTLDAALGAVADWRLGDVTVFAHGHYGWVGDSDAARAANFRLRDVYAYGAGASAHVWPWLSLHLQLERESSVWRDFGFARAADAQLLLWGGFRIATGCESHLELGIGEDLSTYVAPDFTLWASFATRFGAR